ncbi:MarR family winged helix-turn-helix transcriptional regulator [Actinocrispum wychmicini]|uniref:DNA-binding MarR family transcriptional regulator n=1 Tax=Actinocrispum wychmicini TaxID=1213861 RepID=A0A4R2IZH5_9PSEU|nr:MarR family transcriptional regulator [Actinocrispum wychmicini]TCO49808.1 DNA-binding MarR family transcriptional regulator [Actinocrispum wychmicini]
MTDVRWLTTREQVTWRGYLTATGMFMDHLDRQMQRDSGMPLAYFEILAVLSEMPGRSLRMSELAEMCRSSRSRLSHAVSRLEEAGWVRRRACESDKRGSFAELTDAGFKVLEKAAPNHVTTVREHLFDMLTDEQLDQLDQITTAIQNGLTPKCDVAKAELEAEFRAGSASG